jgi:D-cysteine desulfhydrase
MRLAGVTAQLHTCGVCDSPDEFYQIISDLAEGLGLDTSSPGTLGNAREWIQIHQGKGNGYAISTPEELEFLYQVSSSSGVILDPVYSGKGLFYFCEYLRASPERFRKGDKVLFVHTGGLYGLYANEGQLLPLLPTDFVQPLRVEQP